MNLREFLDIWVYRWWVVTLAVVLFAAAGLGYSKLQHRTYQATATAIVHPVQNDKTTSATASSLMGELAYSSLGDTFVSIAESNSLLQAAGRDLGITPSELKKYSVRAATLSGNATLQVLVLGPDPNRAALLANRLVVRTGTEAVTYLPLFALTPLDSAVPPTSPILPKTSQNVLFAALAGLIAGFVVAALSLRLSDLLGSPAQAPLGTLRKSGKLTPALDDYLPSDPVAAGSRGGGSRTS
jgi:capsular polysaccharide biosynthesis protein